MKVHELVLKDLEESMRRIVRMAGSSLEESGRRSGVNCRIGYIVVSVLEEVLGCCEDETLMSWFKMDEEAAIYFVGSASGDGAGFEEGHSKI